jgi:hypothetical protein
MNQGNSTRHLADELEHLCRYWIFQRQTAGSPSGDHHAFSIAISREAGARGSLIGQEVGKELGWTVYDHQLLDRIAQDMGVRTKLLETVDEKQIGWLQETFESALAVPMVTEPAYVHHLVQTVRALGVHGQCVIVGRGAPFILPKEVCLRVRLRAPLSDRVAVLSKDLNLSQEDANRRVQAIDRERRNFVRTYFQREPNDLSHYDLIINTSRLSVAACTRLISEALRDLQAPTKAHSSCPEHDGDATIPPEERRTKGISDRDWGHRIVS